MTRSIRVLAVLAGLAATARPNLARAELGQLALGADVSGVPVDTRSRGFGGAADLRFGLRFGLPRSAFVDRVIFGALFFQPEVLVGYHAIPLDSSPDAVNGGRVGGGLRLGLVPCRPAEVLFTNHYGAAFDHAVAFLWDLGVAVDWRSSTASLGLHASYHHLTNAGGWLEVGPHFEVRWLP